MYKQKTLKSSFSLSGKGLHTGLELTVTFNPAPADYGYKIQRIDLESKPVIEAFAENVKETQRGTVLSKGNVKVSTVEHGLAALYAAGIDNCHIEVDGPEFPILDGSAIEYVENIQRVGIKELDALKDFYVVKNKIEVKDEKTGSSIILLPDNEFCVNVLISYDSKILYNQYASLDDMNDFPTEIAKSRTFVFVREIESLLDAGLIKGGDLDNAIVIYEREMPQERYDKICAIMGVPTMDATKRGYIMHKPLQWDNEPARHKLLDIIGDLALVGKPIKGRIIATRPGHTINNKFARILRKNIILNDAKDTGSLPLTPGNISQQNQPTICSFSISDPLSAASLASFIVFGIVLPQSPSLTISASTASITQRSKTDFSGRCCLLGRPSLPHRLLITGIPTDPLIRSDHSHPLPIIQGNGWEFYPLGMRTDGGDGEERTGIQR